MAIAQQIIQQGGGVPGAAPAGAPPAGGAAPAAPAGAAAGIPELMNPADVAKVLGVTEADVISTIEAGDLKAKKIGSAFRITRAALDEFLKH
jgi:excisionase family DNA binding protein